MATPPLLLNIHISTAIIGEAFKNCFIYMGGFIPIPTTGYEKKAPEFPYKKPSKSCNYRESLKYLSMDWIYLSHYRTYFGSCSKPVRICGSK